tara:strand:+ start:78855 stop:79757 length:903 start_codon:yes stop_codon:yes gene_type:complete
MNYEEALDILGIDSHLSLTMDELKRKYHKLALKYHPDKNGGSDESTKKFQLVNEAFATIESRLKNGPHRIFNENDSSKQNYNQLFQMFMESFLETRDVPEISVVKEIVLSGCKKLSLKLFENMSKEMAVNTLSFLCKYKDILHIENEIIETVKTIIVKKYENDMVFILNPTLDDMLDHNVYKLLVDKKTYFVPLWHSEAYFDGPEGEIIVKCVPTLPDNVFIDETNRIHVELTRKFTVDFFSENSLGFSLGTHKFEIPKLLFKKTHRYHLENQGLGPLDVQDMYNTYQKMGIFINLTFID